MNGIEEARERTCRRLAHALTDGYSQIEVAEATGMTGSAINKFLRQGILGAERYRALAEWLDGQGIAEELEGGIQDDWSLVADQLESLALYLRGSHSTERKVAFLYGYMDFLKRVLDAFRVDGGENAN